MLTVETSVWYLLYASICVAAVLGNCLVVWIVAFRRRMRNPTNLLIANLAVADALSGLLGIPLRFNAALLQRWVFPSLLCPIAPFVESLTFMVSVLTLCATAMERQLTISRSNLHALRLKYTSGIIVGIWLFSMGNCLPVGMFHDTGYLDLELGTISTKPPLHNFSNVSYTVFVCYPVHSENLIWKVYNLYLQSATYFFPVVVINVTLCRVAYIVSQTQPPPVVIRRGSHPEVAVNGVVTQFVAHDTVASLHSMQSQSSMFGKAKRKVSLLLIVIAAAFTICWLPFEVYSLLSEFLPNINSYEHIQTVFLCCHWLAVSNACLNPIIYGFYHEKFRREYIRIVKSFSRQVSKLNVCRGSMSLSDHLRRIGSQASNATSKFSVCTASDCADHLSHSSSRVRLRRLKRRRKNATNVSGSFEVAHFFVETELGLD